MKLNQFAVYQLKRSAETRKLCFRTYQNLMDEKIAVRAENYDQVYLAAALPATVPRRYGKDCGISRQKHLRDTIP